MLDVWRQLIRFQWHWHTLGFELYLRQPNLGTDSLMIISIIRVLPEFLETEMPKTRGYLNFYPNLLFYEYN